MDNERWVMKKDQWSINNAREQWMMIKEKGSNINKQCISINDPWTVKKDQISMNNE